jgi:hypothetical protein
MRLIDVARLQDVRQVVAAHDIAEDQHPPDHRQAARGRHR